MKACWLALFLFILPFTVIGQVSTYDSGFCLPLHHLKLTSNFGYRIHPLSGQLAFHSGIDLSARSDTVFCILDGIVCYTGYDSHLGIYIKVHHGVNLQSIYGHLSVPWVSMADTLYAGQPIGMTGMTGWVTGEHLHFSILSNNRHLNPLTFLKALILRELLTNQTKNNSNERNRNFFNPETSAADRPARGRTQRSRSGALRHRPAGHHFR